MQPNLSAGEEVSGLHRQLLAHGFSTPSAEIDRHFFGPGTRAAVQQCQINYGLIPRLTDQNRWIQSRKPSDMMVHG
jgi:hypothetical protein